VAKDEDKTVLDGDLTSRHMPGHWAWCLAPDCPSPGVVPVARAGWLLSADLPVPPAAGAARLPFCLTRAGW